MVEKKIGCLPVVENDRLVGLITETDILLQYLKDCAGRLRAAGRTTPTRCKNRAPLRAPCCRAARAEEPQVYRKSPGAPVSGAVCPRVLSRGTFLAAVTDSS